MKNRLFDRKMEVIVAGKSYTYPEFEIKFDIPHTTQEEPDVAEVQIYNLSDTSVGAIINNAEIIVNAGYGEDIGTIFTGKVASVLPEWQGVDKITTMLATTIGSSFRNRTINKTYQADTTTEFIIKDLARHIGLSINELSLVHNHVYERGKVISGNIYNEIVKLAKESGSKMYVDGRQIVIRPERVGTKSGAILNYQTGLIGTPVREEREEDGKKIVEYRITSLLNHKIQKDNLIKVESRNLNGTFRVVEVRHNSSFQTEVLVRP